MQLMNNTSINYMENFETPKVLSRRNWTTTM